MAIAGCVLFPASIVGLLYAFGMGPLLCGRAEQSATTACRVLRAMVWTSLVGLPLAAGLLGVAAVVAVWGRRLGG